MINDTPANTAAVNSVSNVSSCVFLYNRNSNPFLNGIAAKNSPETKAVISKNIDCLYSKAAAIANAKSKIQIFTNTLIFLRAFIFFLLFYTYIICYKESEVKSLLTKNDHYFWRIKLVFVTNFNKNKNNPNGDQPGLFLLNL